MSLVRCWFASGLLVVCVGVTVTCWWFVGGLLMIFLSVDWCLLVFVRRLLAIRTFIEQVTKKNKDYFRQCLQILLHQKKRTKNKKVYPTGKIAKK